MSSRCSLRKEAYRYIRERLCKLPLASIRAGPAATIQLEELVLLKEGAVDPSPALVAALIELCSGIVSRAEIEARLLVPFEEYRDKEKADLAEGGIFDPQA